MSSRFFNVEKMTLQALVISTLPFSSLFFSLFSFFIVLFQKDFYFFFLSLLFTSLHFYFLSLMRQVLRM